MRLRTYRLGKDEIEFRAENIIIEQAGYYKGIMEFERERFKKWLINELTDIVETFDGELKDLE